MAENIVTNADDVDLYIEFPDGDLHRVVAQDFTITAEQTISSISGIGQNIPKGLTKGDLEYSFDFSIQGEDIVVMDKVSDDVGDSNPFDMTAQKVDDRAEGGFIEWQYALTTCLADTDEISGSTGEVIEYSVEGMAAGFDKDINLAD